MRTQEAFKINILDCAGKIWLEFYKIYLNPEWKQEHIFKAPNRFDKNPSIYINPSKNVWYDNGGENIGGWIISFVNYIYWNEIHDTKNALKILDGLFPHLKHPSKLNKAKKALFIAENKSPTLWDNGKKEKEGVFEILSIQELYYYPLKNYLTEDRGINLKYASSYVKQINYKNINTWKSFFWVGFKSWEAYSIRQKNFKGFVWNKPNISIIKSNSEKVLIFEGFIDFLSYLTAKKTNKPLYTAIVLNSAVMIWKAIKYIKENPEIKEVLFFRDRDTAGLKTFKKIELDLSNIKIIDMSENIKPFKDLNDWLINQLATHKKG